jgi:ABC-type molybdate transport system permease subunit
MFAGIRPETRTLAIEVYILNSQPGAAYEARMWRLVAAAVVLSFMALAASEYFTRRGRRHASA